MSKFLETPELVEMLLPFLNAENTLAFAESGVINIKTLQGTLAWKKLVRRTIPSNKNPVYNNSRDIQNRYNEVAPLIEILMMMQDCKSSELDLLNLICERFPPTVAEGEEEEVESVTLLSNSSSQTKTVSPLGFFLLEEVESVLGSLEYQVEQIKIDYSTAGKFKQDDYLLPTLSSRVTRQDEKVKLIEFKTIDVHLDMDMEVFLNVVENCERVKLDEVELEDWLDPIGWTKLRRVLSCDHVSLSCLNPSRDGLLGRGSGKPEGAGPANRGDLRVIWDLTEDHWDVWFWAGETLASIPFFKEGVAPPGPNVGEVGWERLEELLDTRDEDLEEWLEDIQEDIGVKSTDDEAEEGIVAEQNDEEEGN